MGGGPNVRVGLGGGGLDWEVFVFFWGGGQFLSGWGGVRGEGGGGLGGAGGGGVNFSLEEGGLGEFGCVCAFFLGGGLGVSVICSKWCTPEYFHNQILNFKIHIWNYCDFTRSVP